MNEPQHWISEEACTGMRSMMMGVSRTWGETESRMWYGMDRTEQARQLLVLASSLSLPFPLLPEFWPSQYSSSH